MQAYKIMARNTRTKIRVQTQFLNGYVVTDYEEACRLSVNLAEKQQRRSRDPWIPEVETYTVKDQ
jgi:hypothetical protein